MEWIRSRGRGRGRGRSILACARAFWVGFGDVLLWGNGWVGRKEKREIDDGMGWDGAHPSIYLSIRVALRLWKGMRMRVSLVCR